MKPLAGSDRWSTIERARLRAPGNRPADALLWITRGGVLLAAGAALWLLYVAAMPLGGAEGVEGEAPPQVPRVEIPTPGGDQRRETLARLGAVNLFDAEREAWSNRPRERTAEADGKPAEGKSAAPVPAAGTQSTVIGGQSVLVTKAESLPEDVKAALTGLALRGIYTPLNGQEPVAMISRVHNGPNPMLSDVFRPGDEFEDKQHPQAKWRVVAIDKPGRRVVLQRGGINAVLGLYSSATPTAAAPDGEKLPEAAKSTGRTIVLQTKEEVGSALREAKLSDAEVKRLLELAEMSPEDAAAAAKIAALTSANAEQAKDQKPGKRPPPPGLEAIAKLLQQPPKQMEESSPSPAPAETAEPAGPAPKPE